MRYIHPIPGPVTIIDSVTKQPLPGAQPIPFSQTIRIAAHGLIRRQLLDVLDVMAIIQDAEEAEAEGARGVLALGEPQYEALRGEFRRPQEFSPNFLIGGGFAHVRAVLDAKETKPELPKVETTPSAQ